MSQKNLFLSVALIVGAVGTVAAPSQSCAAAEKFDWPLSGPMALAYLVDNVQFHLDQPVLIPGIRPENDKPKKAAAVLGKRTTDRDWVLEDRDRAIWVSGISAPGYDQPFVLAGRLIESEGVLSIKASLLMKVGQKERTSLSPGEHVFYELPGNKSVTCPVELSGDSVEIVHHNPFEYVVLKTVKRGPAKLKVFSKWWNEPEVKLLSEYELVVE